MSMLITVATACAKEIEITPAMPPADARKAVASATAGDVVRFRAGTYRLPMLTLKSGEAGKPITLEAAAGETVELKGSQLVTGWQPHAPGVWKVTGWKTNSQQVFVNGTPLQQIGVSNRWHREKLWADHVCLPPVGKDLNDLTAGSFYYDAPNTTLYVKLTADADPNGKQVEVSVNDYVLDGPNSSYVTLKGLTFSHANSTGKDARQGIVRLGGRGWLIEGCSFTWGDFAGLAMSGDDHVIRKCNISHNGALGVDLNGSDEAHQYRWYDTRPPMNILVEDCTISDNNYRKFFDQWHAGGFKLVPSIRGFTVRGCKVERNGGAGVWFDGGLGSNVVENNLIADNITGIFYEISGPAGDGADAFGCQIRNNVVARSRNQGIYISASRKAIVENNTCYQNRWDIVIAGMPRKEFGGQKLENNVVRNNIVNGKVTDITIFTGKDSANNTADGNFYVGQGDKAVRGFNASDKGYDSNLTPDLNKVRESGYEKTGVVGDPMWLDADKLDFRLKDGSPAKGKGWQAKE